MLLVSIVLVLIGAANGELEMVQVLFRHGDRAPTAPYPLDPYQDAHKFWPNGWSQLTERGAGQCRELGSWLRDRYLLSERPLLHQPRFDRHTVYARSSDKDRCIESMQHVVHSLFPSDATVPVHTYSNYKRDLMLKPNSVVCPRHDRLREAHVESLVSQTRHHYEELFQLLAKFTGFATVDFHNVVDIYNAIFRERENGLVQPEWTQLPVPGHNRTIFESIVHMKTLSRLNEVRTPVMAKLRGGYLTGQLLENMRRTLTGENRKKLFLFSSHDATLSALLSNLDISNGLIPPYTSAIILELHSVQTKPFVRIMFRNETAHDAEPHVMRAPWCDFAEFCPMDRVERELAIRLITDRPEFDRLCATADESEQAAPADNNNNNDDDDHLERRWPVTMAATAAWLVTLGHVHFSRLFNTVLLYLIVFPFLGF